MKSPEKIIRQAQRLFIHNKHVASQTTEIQRMSQSCYSTTQTNLSNKLSVNARIISQLKMAYEQKNYKEQLTGFKELGDVYLKDQQYVDAIAVYNFALGIVKNSTKRNYDINNVALYREDLKSSIKHAEKEFLTTINAYNILPTDIEMDEKYRKKLDAIRKDTKISLEQQKSVNESLSTCNTENQSQLANRFQSEAKLCEEILSTQQIYKVTSQNIRELIKKLVQACQENLGPEPCQYAIIALGSLARDEATPYSDLEFAILLETENDEIKQYFRNLTVLLQIKIINLGETTPRMQNIKDLAFLSERFIESPVPNGLAFDGQMESGCKTPLGNLHLKSIKPGKEYELIQTPSVMAAFNETKNYQKDRYLANILRTVSLIDGESSLVDEYQKQLALHEPQVLAQERALELLSTDLERYLPRFGRKTNKGEEYGVKYHLYRLPTLIIDALTRYYSIPANSVWEKINRLKDIKLFDDISAANLVMAIDKISNLRLHTYLNAGEQKENVLDIDEQSILEIHYSLLPLRKAAKTFLSSQGKLCHFNNKHLYDNSDNTRAKIYYRRYKFEKAFYYALRALGYAQALNKDFKEFISFIKHSDIQFFEMPTQDKQSENLIKICLNCSINLNRTNDSYVLIRSPVEETDFNSCLKHALDVYNEDDYDKADEYFKKAGKLFKFRTNFITELCNIYNHLGLIRHEQSKYELAFGYFTKGLELVEKYCLENTEVHRNLLNNIARYYSAVSKYQQAIKYFKQVLKLDYREEGSNYIESAKSLAQLGHAQLYTDEQAQAKEHIDNALILLKTYVKLDIEARHIYNRIGNFFYKISEISADNQWLWSTYLDKAIENYEHAQKLYEDRPGYKNKDQVTNLFNLIQVCQLRKDHTKTKKYLSLLHNININSDLFELVVQRSCLLAKELRTNGKHEDALNYYNEAYETLTRHAKKHHLLFISVYSSRSICYEEMRKYREALVDAEKVLEVYQANNSPNGNIERTRSRISLLQEKINNKYYLSF